MADRAGPTCVHHPTVGGVAQCVVCGDVLCAACSTRVRGRNLCASCLAAQLTAAGRDDGAPAGPVLEVLSGALALAAFAGLVAAGLGLLAVLHALG